MPGFLELKELCDTALIIQENPVVIKNQQIFQNDIDIYLTNIEFSIKYKFNIQTKEESVNELTF